MPPPSEACALRLPAYAKINLSLEIIGRRADGFHELVSVSQIISLADHLTASPATRLHVTVTPSLVDEESNLVLRSAEALALACGRQASGRIHLRKHIPVAAGLGGGSSDAAATLRLLDRLWGTQVDEGRMHEIAATLGSDVPLFLGGGTSLIRGRGERVEPLPPAPPLWFVLVCPGGAPPDKTRTLYRALARDEWSNGATTLALADRLRAGAGLDEALLVNSFDGAASRVYGDFAAMRQRLSDLTGAEFHLTGAGPTLFACFQKPRDARSVAAVLARAKFEAYVAHSVAQRPSIRASHGLSGRSSA